MISGKETEIRWTRKCIINRTNPPEQDAQMVKYILRIVNDNDVSVDATQNFDHQELGIQIAGTHDPLYVSSLLNDRVSPSPSPFLFR